MKTLKEDWLIWIILIVPFVFTAIVWNRLPEEIATHFDMSGTPNDYSGKAFGTLFAPLLNVGLYFLFIALPKIDPRKKNYRLFGDKYKVIRLVLHAFLTFAFFVEIFYALGYQFNLGLLIMYGVLLLFLVLGNYMGNMRPNFFIGIRSPWTLSSEQVWMKTHRLTGKLWVFSTLLLMVLLPFIPFPDVAFGIYIAVITLIPYGYSYLEYKKEEQQKPS
jgi:uncharacterized membrane protein